MGKSEVTLLLKVRQSIRTKQGLGAEGEKDKELENEKDEELEKED